MIIIIIIIMVMVNGAKVGAVGSEFFFLFCLIG